VDRPWESCITICQQWAWKPNDKMKSERECLQALITCAGGDGNLLLNVCAWPVRSVHGYRGALADLSQGGMDAASIACVDAKVNTLGCSVCGGTMRMLGIVATKTGASRRYKCTCGHTEDEKDSQHRPHPGKIEAILPEGIEEFS